MLEALGVDFKEIIFAILNFLVLVVVLGKFLYKPFIGALETRKQNIQATYDAADAVNRRADLKMAEYEKRIAKVEEEAREIIREGKSRAEEQAGIIIEEANKKASDIVGRAEQAASLEKAKAMDELKDEIADMVIMAAEQVVGREIEKDGHNAIIDDVINKARDAQWQN